LKCDAKKGQVHNLPFFYLLLFSDNLDIIIA
jgi:hypothetical protein